MSTPILATKLYIPPPRPKAVLRPQLTERLNEGLHHRLTLISAPAGFGKTTLVSEWIAAWGRPVAWLSLDEGDNDCESVFKDSGGDPPGSIPQNNTPHQHQSVYTTTPWRLYIPCSLSKRLSRRASNAPGTRECSTILNR